METEKEGDQETFERKLELELNVGKVLWVSPSLGQH